MTYYQYVKEYFANLTVEQVQLMEHDCTLMEEFVAAGEKMIQSIRASAEVLKFKANALDECAENIQSCRDEAEIIRVMLSKCDHDWGRDGAHSNVYCKKCFVDKPAYLVKVDGVA